ncbi:hypothetical protein DL98DRAFT_567186 [Cadophora sp. DSE1049]|nr:hypothetical protein DL98DRAFT_567186 [Cadophora sp. DSE1049]
MASTVAAAETALVVRDTVGSAVSSASTPATTTATKHTTASTALTVSKAKVVKTVPKLTDALTTVTIIMKSGERKKEYIVYKEFACYYSPMLDAAFNGPFIEGKSNTMTIDDFPFPDAFGLIQCWMYTMKIEHPLNNPLTVSGYCLAWILADRLLIPKLQNQAVTEICTKKLPLATMPNVKMVYENTSPDSKLRKLVAYICAFEMEPEMWATRDGDGDGDIPSQFLVDVATEHKRECKRVTRRDFNYRAVPPRKIDLQQYMVPEIAL